jgi:hypothetical protein
MPGSYAHITLVNVLRRPQTLDGISGFASEARTALATYFRYCELGSVSPDYPYLVIENTDAKKWADNMHYYGIGDMIKTGIEGLKTMQGDDHDACLAWLFGFAAHVGMDTTVHPVVRNIVGEYAEHSKDHRVCEMNEDVYIFKRMNLEGVALSNHLEEGIQKCDMRIIEGIWAKMLEKTHPDEFVSNPPEFAAWHKHFEPVVEDIASHGYKLLLFGRHALTKTGFLYPQEAEIDAAKFINNLPSPAGTKGYDEIFNYAVGNVAALWQHISAAVFSDSTDYQTVFGNWNLDEGVLQQDIEATGRGKYIFWGGSL